MSFVLATIGLFVTNQAKEQHHCHDGDHVRDEDEGQGEVESRIVDNVSCVRIGKGFNLDVTSWTARIPIKGGLIDPLLWFVSGEHCCWNT